MVIKSEPGLRGRVKGPVKEAPASRMIVSPLCAASSAFCKLPPRLTVIEFLPGVEARRGRSRCKAKARQAVNKSPPSASNRNFPLLFRAFILTRSKLYGLSFLATAVILRSTIMQPVVAELEILQRDRFPAQPMPPPCRSPRRLLSRRSHFEPDFNAAALKNMLQRPQCTS